MSSGRRRLRTCRRNCGSLWRRGCTSGARSPGACEQKGLSVCPGRDDRAAVPFANDVRPEPRALKLLGQQDLVARQERRLHGLLHEVLRTVPEGVAACEQRRPRRRAHRRDVEAAERDSLSQQLGDGRRVRDGAGVAGEAGEIVPADVVQQDERHVRRPVARSLGHARRGRRPAPLRVVAPLPPTCCSLLGLLGQSRRCAGEHTTCRAGGLV